ncbi:MAG TPA: UDP-N-acetylmuramoyl-L-alanyl-D-glutamate--2,6-diaminopimelate ligase [Burkholderiales bacterium]|nr:UDP-N-acetylmuramoyl-L-alanyl-D-glutamate--2,6-diaminopimelate ligase [Burkholderiales bacterium]
MARDQASQLLGQLAARGVRVSGLATDSRQVQRGDVFLAWPGARVDGRAHVADAVAAGAAAVLWERDGFEWNPDWTLPNIAVPGLRALAGELAHEAYGRPSEKLWTMGVTGTNGKTSCSQWIAQACTACGARTAVIGTLGIGFPPPLDDASALGNEENAWNLTPVANTTPDPVLLHRSLAGLLAQGAQGVAMEASSIGLDQGRVNGVAFGAALFTNLSRDHLDYHGDMETYARAKQKLFEMPGLKHAVLNLDDVQGVTISRLLAGSGVTRTGYSASSGVAMRAGLECWLEAHDVAVSSAGIAFTVKSSWGDARVESRLLGRFNIANLLGVLGTMLVSGVPFFQAAAALARLAAVPGRLQRHGGGAQPLVVVDYAHTPDALEKTLVTLKDVARATNGRLLCVFGCGGDRDRGKRPLMGAVALRHADAIVLTSDNPRSEDPQAIIDDILSGMAAAQAQPQAEPDRARAVRLALDQARAGDVVLLAGKGHEDYQEIGGRKLPFSDGAAAAEALAQWRGPA